MVVCVAGAVRVLFVLGCTPQVEHAGSVLDENEPKRCNKDAAKITHGLKNLGAEVITGLDDGVPGRSALNLKRKKSARFRGETRTAAPLLLLPG
jgi:hypothetical protein